MSAATLQAEALAAGLPALLVQAERVAATVAQGLHGRRRVGTGESFWQFRPYVPGDPINRIDWRRSARSDQPHLRETEWDAAQTVALWCDNSAGMHWHSSAAVPPKVERARLIALALGSLLLRAGERVRLLGGGRLSGLPQLAEALTQPSHDLRAKLPPPHGQAVLFGDFLGDLAPVERFLGSCAALPAGGHLVQVLDPAEVDLPFTGRVRFTALGHPLALTIPKTEAIREAYQDRLRQRQEALVRLTGSAGFTFIAHVTGSSPTAPLLALCTRLCGVDAQGWGIS